MEPFFLEKIGEGKGVKKGRGKIYSFVVCFLYFLRSYLKKSIKGKIPSVSVSESWIATKPTPPISLIMFRALWPKSLEIGNEPSWESDGETGFFFGNFHLRREKLPTTGLMMMMTCF